MIGSNAAAIVTSVADIQAMGSDTMMKIPRNTMRAVMLPLISCFDGEATISDCGEGSGPFPAAIGDSNIAKEPLLEWQRPGVGSTPVRAIASMAYSDFGREGVNRLAALVAGNYEGCKMGWHGASPPCQKGESFTATHPIKFDFQARNSYFSLCLVQAERNCRERGE